MNESADVIICGSGAAGLMAAVQLSDLGLRPLVVEKTSRYGGTSATSGGGLWIPNHGIGSHSDSNDQALKYLKRVCKGEYRLNKLEAYLDACPQMVHYLQSLGVEFISVPGFPDYFADAPGTSAGRSLFPLEIDGAKLGDEFFCMRELPPIFKLFNRYALNLEQSFALSARKFGGQLVVAKLILKYWAGIAWRRKAPIDRRLTQGRALIGGLRKALLDRNVILRLNTRVTKLLAKNSKACGLEAVSGAHQQIRSA